jgi:hypothetical protein
VDDLLHDKTRPSRLAPLSPEVAARVVGLTLEAPPGETTHWTAAAMATAGGSGADRGGKSADGIGFQQVWLSS